MEKKVCRWAHNPKFKVQILVPHKEKGKGEKKKERKEEKERKIERRFKRKDGH